MNENNKTKYLFLDYFPNHKFRYLDTTGNKRPPISSSEKMPELNAKGYDSYFTVNGFIGENEKIENCSNLNAFWVDIDGRKDAKELEEIKKRIYPTFIIETKNGYHIYWLLDEPIYKEDCTEAEWKDALKRFERIEHNVVRTLNGDTNCMDVPRIMRVPDTYYWKKSGNAYLNGINGVFKIKGIDKKVGARYSMEAIEEAFPMKEMPAQTPAVFDDKRGEALKKYAETERRDFFSRINKAYPVEDRPSFKSLISGAAGTLPQEGMRNKALLIAATLMREAGWKQTKAIEHIKEVGWHGMELERGGITEIQNTIKSAYANNYTFSFKNEIIVHNTTPEEQRLIQEAYTAVAKVRKETDKIRFTTYEREILIKYPYLRKNEIGLIFNYQNGVYKMMSDMEMSNIVLSGLDEDFLWGYRTKKHVSDKVACLLSIIPDLELTNDGGYILNLKNGLLNIRTLELSPHTPEFVSLVQFNVAYDPTATCPTWESCIEAWMEGDEYKEKTDLLQQFAGYCLSSSMLYDRAMFLVGDGGNGKSTFVDTIAMLIGKDAVSHIDLESLYGQYGMKGLIGKRLNIIEEVQGNFYHSNKLKKLISGEQVTIDIKYKDQFSFRPQAKFIFAVNIMPRVDDSSSATERRMCVVLFNNNFRDAPNTALRSDTGLLAEELPGILNWMLEGARKLVDMGKFVITKEQTRALSEYRQENSSVEGFIGECVDFAEGTEATTKDLYEQYKAFCQRDGRKFKSCISFTKEMKAYGYKTRKYYFKEREYGSAPNKFVGVYLVDEWKQNNTAQREFRDF
jgi:putative DNA primase/helicase